MTVEIDRGDMTRILRKIAVISNPAVYKPAMVEAQELAREFMREYPDKSRGAFTALATEGQRRAFWARVSAGLASVDGQGYVRTSKLRDAWKRGPVTVGDDSITGVVTNAQPFARFVQGDRLQQPFHTASKWPTPGDFRRRKGKEVAEIFADRARVLINK